MHFVLGRDIRFCFIGNSTYFLDLDRNRYSVIHGDCSEIFQKLVARAGEIDVADYSKVESLIERGYIVQSSEIGTFGKQVNQEPAEREFRTFPQARPSLFQTVSAIWWQIRSRNRLRSVTFAALVRVLANDEVVERLDPTDADFRARALAEAFARSDQFLGRTDRCLVRSIAMLGLCRLNGLNPRLIFGVRAEPFTAHCWVQRAGVVLNDTVEHIRTFTPIMAI